MIKNVIHLPGDSVFISDISVPQPDDISDVGSTLVCVTTNINPACCRASDSNGSTTDRAGAVGEWHYPNRTLVPHIYKNVIDFARVGYTQECIHVKFLNY